MKKRIADIILSTVVERGITDCFAVVGGGAMYLDNALLHNSELTKYFNHHEQACAMAAEAYARASGRMALVCVTSGPGGTNTLTGVMGAWVDSIPMLVISGQVRYEVSVPKTGLNLRTRGVQEFNIVDTVKTMTKYSKLVTDPLDIKREINKAIDIALSGRRGPVWLDIPQDIQSAYVEEDDLYTYIPEEQDNNQNLETSFIFDELEQSRRPVFLVGAGVLSSGLREKFRSILNAIQIPVVSSFNGSDVLYRENNYCMGPIGPCGQRTANIAVQNSDLVISLGCSLGFSTTGFDQDNFAPGAKLIAIDIDDQELKKPGLKFYRQVQCDLTEFLNKIDDGRCYTAPKEWLDYCMMLKQRFSPYESANNKGYDERVCSYVFWEKYFETAPEDEVLVLGNNSAITSALQIGNRFKNQHILTNYNCGSMGYDIPAALGVSIALKREVVLATGDGSFMMNLQELQTIVHHDLPIKIALFENEGYNAIRQTSKNFFNGELIGCTPKTGVSFPSFEKIAEAFGLEYIKCDSNKMVKACIDQLLKTDGPAILEVSQLLDDPVSPKVMSRTDKNGKMLSPALQDMYPFISEEEMKELMISRKE